MSRTRRSPRTSAPLRRHILHGGRRSHGIRLIAAIAILLASAIPVERAAVSGFERSAFEAINRLPDALFTPVNAVMQFGSLFAVPLVALAAIVWTRRMRVGADLALSGVAAWGLARFVKAAVERGRPFDLLGEVIMRGDTPTGQGYVSGHTAVAFALATVASVYLGAKGKTVVWTIAVIVGLARIYVGAHLPLDVVGGAAMGWALGSLTHFLVLPEVTGRDPDADAWEVRAQHP